MLALFLLAFKILIYQWYIYVYNFKRIIKLYTKSRLKIVTDQIYTKRHFCAEDHFFTRLKN